jgi:hypothetical protein
VVDDESGNNIAVLLGNGDGTFRRTYHLPRREPRHTRSPSRRLIVMASSSVATANGDDNSVSFLMGLGDGSFSARVDVNDRNQPLCSGALEI